ncbi:MAG: AraC family transcriptional regulator [Bacillota bacterium]|nr:AraC family transcriptional regulator [Bacillota bacterium]
MNDTFKFYVYGRSIPGEHWDINKSLRVNRLYYIHSGTAYVKLENGTDLKLIPGYVYIFPENFSFSPRQDMSNPLDHSYVDFSLWPPFDFFGPASINAEKYPTVKAAALAFSEYIKSHPFTLINNGESNDYTELAKLYLYGLLKLIDEEISLPRIKDKRISDVLLYIQNHYNEELSVVNLSKQFHLELNYFIRLFKKITGVSPYNYIKSLRLNMAIYMLESGMAVSAAAEETGYSSPSAFSKAFRQHTGFSPSELKKR